MADLYVLEGNKYEGRYPRTNRFAYKPRRYFVREVPGVVYGDPIELLGSLGLGPMTISNQALLQAQAKKKGVTLTQKELYAPTKETFVKAGMKPSKGNIFERVAKSTLAPGAHIVANVSRAAVHEVARPVAHVAATGGRAVAKAVVYSADVTRRVAKRLIKGIAKKVLFHGTTLLGESLSAIPKNAAKGVLMPLATGAVLASPVTAPAAPAVPVLVNEVINELYSAIEAKIKAGLSPGDAAKAAKADLDKLEPGEENDPKPGFNPWIIGGALALLAFFLLRRSD